MTLDEVKSIATKIADEYSSISPNFIVSENPEKCFHVQCCAVTSDFLNHSPIYQIGRVVIERFAKDRKAVVRVSPEVAAYTDFLTNTKFVRSYVRFSFEDVPGEWKICSPTAESVNFGFV